MNPIRSIAGRGSRLLASVGLVAGITQVHAGSATYDFKTDPTQDSKFVVVGNNPQPWQGTGGKSDGFLALTYPVNSQNTTVVFPDIDDGKIVTSFKFVCDLRVGNSVGDRPADGFSISFARGNDPLLDDPNNTGAFAGGIPEGGSTTGIAISFDTWQGNTLPDGGDIEGIIVRVDNKTILRQPLPVRHGACNDVNSLQTGPRDAAYWDGGGDPQLPESWAGLCWAEFSAEVDSAGKVTVAYKGKTILDKVQTSYFPSKGRLIMAGRTGGANEHTHVDNIRLTTEATAADTVAPTVPGNLKVASAGARRVLLTWDPSTDNSGRVGYQIEKDGTLIPGFVTDPRFEDLNVSPGKTYAYKVRATDISENASAFVSASATTAQEVDSVGFLLAEIYDNIGGTPVTGLYESDKFPGSPDRGRYLNGLTFGEPAFGNTYGENFGIRIAGVITAPETGDYHFFVRSDDASQFFLNRNGAAIPNPTSDTPIAEETGCCDAFKEPDPGAGQPFETTTDPISLQAGRQYGFVFIVKEGGGGDWGQVAMRKVGDPTPASQLKPIQGAILTGKSDPVGASVVVSQAPANQTVMATDKASFTVAAQTSSPYTKDVVYQWYRNGAIIPGATGASYSIAETKISDNGAKFKVLVAVPGASATTAEATLTVTPDVVGPKVVSARRNFGAPTKVTIRFNEDLDAASAAAAANYTISGGVTVSSATLLASKRAVELTTSAIADGGTHTVTLANVKDVSGNAVAANTTAALTFERGILFVTAPQPINAADTAIQSRLESLGFNVEVIAGADSDTANANGKHLIIVSSTLGSATVGDKFRDVAVPVIHWEPALQDNFLQTLDQDNVTRGVQVGNSVKIVNPTHPLAAGLKAGLTQVITADDNLSWGVVGDGATVIAEHGNDPSRKSIYAYDKGSKLIDGSTAPEKRLFIFFFDNTAANVTADGWRLFDAAVYWAQGLPVPIPSTGNPVELGTTVNGYQDDFTGETRNPLWVPRGPGGDLYLQSDGVLTVTPRSGDPNHLLYEAPGYSNSTQEVLARVRVTAFGTGDPSRAGIATTVSTANSQGINFHFRDHAQDGVTGRQFKLLDDARAWGPAGIKLDWKNNTWYWMRLRHEPNAGGGTDDVFAKVWVADGQTPEPTDWQNKWNYIPTRAARTGFAGITGSSINGVGNFEVDYILIKADGLPPVKVDFAPVGPAALTPKLTAQRSGNNIVLSWTGAISELRSADDVAGPWTKVTGDQASPRSFSVTAGARKYYRLVPLQ